MTAPIEARVYARTAPFWQRAAVYGAGGVLLASGAVAYESFPIADSLLGLGAFVILIAPFLLRFRNPQDAKIAVFPGKIVIFRDRDFPWTIRTRQLIGACVARRDDRYVLSLCNERRAGMSPIAIETSDAGGVKDIRKALGIRRGGFGDLTWSLRGRLLEKIETGARAIAAFGLMLGWAANRLGIGWSLPLTVAGWCIGITLVTLALGLIAPAPALTLTRSNIISGTTTDEQAFRVGYGEVREVIETDSEFALQLLDGKPVSFACPPAVLTAAGLRGEEREVLLTQLRGAVRAAHGVATDSSEDALPIAQLARGNDSAIDWLARIDALAQTQESGGYRGSQIAVDDVWKLLESHDTITEMRIAAARFLMRATPENKHDRIAAALASIHDEAERARVRVVLDTEIQVAADDLDSLEDVARRS